MVWNTSMKDSKFQEENPLSQDSPEKWRRPWLWGDIEELGRAEAGFWWMGGTCKLHVNSEYTEEVEWFKQRHHNLKRRKLNQEFSYLNL